MLLLDRVQKKIKERFGPLELSEFATLRHHFAGKRGLEVGGPSGIFQSGDIFPVYDFAEQIDGVNFSGYTVWEKTISAGRTYQYAPDKIGEQFILEASDLQSIPDESYDFLLASHCLEHCANAIQTLKEWKRVVKPNGTLVLALPDKRVTFDRNRPTTTFEHLQQDYKTGISEDDLTHLPEILQLHDLSRDPGVANRVVFEERSQQNFQNRCLHHHIFDIALLQQLFQHIQLDVLMTTKFLPSLLICGQKRSSGESI